MIANQKGGVGKTTTAINLSACLADLGKQVLLIDSDSQANATSGLGLEKKPGASFYQSLLGNGKISEAIKATRRKNLEMIPSEVDLCGADVELAELPDSVGRLKALLQPLQKQGYYDYIFIDCPPSLSLLTMNAFAAADALVVPLQCEYYSLEGVAALQGLVDQIRDSGANPNLTISGVLLTMFDGRIRLARQVVDEVRQFFGKAVFESIIPRTTRLAEAPSHGCPIVDYDPRSAGAEAYRVLAEEFVYREEGRLVSRVGGSLSEETD